MKNYRYGRILVLLAIVHWLLDAPTLASAQVEPPTEAQEQQSDNQSDESRERIAASQSRATFRIELILYSIRLRHSPSAIQYFPDGESITAGRAQIEKILDNKVGLVFEKVYLNDICEFLTDTYNVNIILDGRVIPPPKPGESNVNGVSPDSEYVTDGIVEYVNLQNVTVKQCLNAVLRPLGLAFSVQSNFVWISTQEKIETESFGAFYRPSSAYTFRQDGAYVVNDKETILLGRPEVTWNGKPEPLSVDITVLAQPNLMLVEGQKGEILVTDSTPIEYFERSEPNDAESFTLKTLEASAGLRTSVIITKLESVDEVSVQLSLDVDRVGERRALEGVSLNVGKPEVAHSEHFDVHRVRMGRWASLIGSADPNSALLALFKVSPAER